MAIGNDNNNGAKAHVEYKDEGDASRNNLSDDNSIKYDIEPIGYFDFLVKHRNRIVKASISIRFTNDQVKGIVETLRRYVPIDSGVGVMLMVAVDDSKSSMLYQDGVAIQDFVIKIDSVVPIEDSELVSGDQDASGQLVFDWS